MRISDWSSDVCSSDLISGWDCSRIGTCGTPSAPRRRPRSRTCSRSDARVEGALVKPGIKPGRIMPGTPRISGNADASQQYSTAHLTKAGSWFAVIRVAGVVHGKLDISNVKVTISHDMEGRGIHRRGWIHYLSGRV